MDQFMSIVESVNGAINDFVWGIPCLVLLIGTGLYYTIRLGFMQFRHPVFLFKETVVKAFKKKDDESKAPGELTSFQAAMTSVGAIVGSGNIAGVCGIGGFGHTFSDCRNHVQQYRRNGNADRRSAEPDYRLFCPAGLYGIFDQPGSFYLCIDGSLHGVPLALLP